MRTQQQRQADDELVGLFASITQWERGGKRAPHKPLLLLIALAQIQNSKHSSIRFSEADTRLGCLLRDYGPPTKARPEYPFWRLQSDGLWEVPGHSEIVVTSGGDASKASLLRIDPIGRLPDAITRVLAARPALVNRIARLLLDRNFEPSMHEGILDDVGMPWVVDGLARVRDPLFRDLVLRAYEHRCALCGYDGRLGSVDLGLEAAHVRWHAASGPDEVENGIAFCAFHHAVFDRGAISIERGRVLVSQDVSGGNEVQALLLRFVGSSYRAPQVPYKAPAEAYASWHRREVFRSPARGQS